MQEEPVAGTLFVFPFDRRAVSPTAAVREISAALPNIDAQTLLFLLHIERVRVCGAQTAETVLDRKSAAHPHSGRDVVLAKRRNDYAINEEWFVWQRPLDALGEPEHRVEIAFMVRADIDTRLLARRESSPLVVFFPTQKETFLGFLIQGPYRTTPARDNVPEHDPWNQFLVRETATLLAAVLADLRDEGLLTVDVLGGMPLEAARFGQCTMFRGLFDSARDALARGALIPVAGGGYGPAGALAPARGATLPELLSAGPLGALHAAGPTRAAAP